MADAVMHPPIDAYEPPLMGTNSRKLGMWLFLLSDSLTFGALIFAYSYSRMSTPNWPTPFNSGSIINATIMTGVLLTSSLTMVLAVAASARGNVKATVQWLLATMACGAAFVVLHLREWIKLITVEHMWFNQGPGGVPQFAGTFFTLTGMHMLHVTIGVLYLGGVAWRFRRGTLRANDVEVSGLYWHFVDLVWMFIFPMVYLMSTRIQ